MCRSLVLSRRPTSQKVSTDKGIPTVVKFFNVVTARELVSQGKQADLLIGNNVLAHVPALNDFVSGIKLILKPRGIVTMEFPYIMRLVEEKQFDTIYHEHFSYFSFGTVDRIFSKHGLKIFDVEEVSTHGGSLRIFGCHREEASLSTSSNVGQLKGAEESAGFSTLDRYLSFLKLCKRRSANSWSF